MLPAKGSLQLGQRTDGEVEIDEEDGVGAGQVVHKD